MKGRKPKPTHLKLVQGNPGQRRLPENEPKPRGDGERPAFLTGRAAEIWAEHAPEMRRLRLLTSVDAPMFGVWCCLMASFEADPGGMGAQRISQLRGLAASFGMEPSARSRISIADSGRKDDPAEKFFAG